VWAGLATVLAATVLLLVPPAVADSTGTCSEAGTTTVTVTCTAGMGTWTPPAGVTSATFDVEGGHGGGVSGVGGGGGAGGKVTGTLTVSSASTYTVLVGSQGGSGSGSAAGAGGSNGGGSGSAAGGSGGGGTTSAGAGGGAGSEIDLGSTRLVVAGGGGGGTAGVGAGTGGSGGGSSGTAGAGGSSGLDDAGGGSPGSSSSAGAGGTAGCSGCASGQAGSGSGGGTGGAGTFNGDGGGGGGGGYFGGGGGGGTDGSGGGGGGGGSGHVDASVTSSTMTTGGGPPGDGTVVITYTKATSTTTLGSSSNPSTAGQAVTFTATVTGNSPTGTVNFKDGGTTIAGCGAQTVSGGSATCTSSGLSVGSHSITAVYSGDSGNDASTSSTLTQTVNQAPSSTGLGSSLNPSTAGQSVTFTATVTGDSPSGTVNFKDGGTTIGGCGAQVLSGGSATCSTSGLSVGSHSITAVYSGDTNNQASTSSALTQTVVNAPNHAPTANAGADQTVASGATVNLDGTGSSDPDGGALTYAWTQTSGPTVTLAGANTATPSFTAPTGPATLIFSLQVCDPSNACSTDSVTINVNAPTPTAEEQLSALKAAVAGVGPDKNLGKQVKKIQGYVAANNIAKACKELKAFVKQVKALAANKKISAAKAATLIDLAKNIQKTLGC
jgi:hypothetical protein